MPSFKTPQQMRAHDLEHGLPPAKPEVLLFSSIAHLIPDDTKRQIEAKRRDLERKEGRSAKRRKWKSS